jgi:hypothetical protein
LELQKAPIAEAAKREHCAFTVVGHSGLTSEALFAVGGATGSTQRSSAPAVTEQPCVWVEQAAQEPRQSLEKRFQGSPWWRPLAIK